MNRLALTIPFMLQPLLTSTMPMHGTTQVALFNLVEVEPFYKAYRVARPDFVVMVASFAFTLFVNIEVGRQATATTPPLHPCL